MVHEENDLGVTLQDIISTEAHKQAVWGKFQFHFMDKEMMKKLALIKSKLEYAAIVWLPH